MAMRACGTLSPSCCGFTSGRRSPAGGRCSNGRPGPRTNSSTTLKASAGFNVDTSAAPVPVKRSFDTAFVFPPQDTKLKVGDTPRIAETLGYAGTIVELSAEDGRVVLRRGAKSGAMPERFSLVPAPINLQGVPDAVHGVCRSLRSRGRPRPIRRCSIS